MWVRHKICFIGTSDKLGSNKCNMSQTKICFIGTSDIVVELSSNKWNMSSRKHVSQKFDYRITGRLLLWECSARESGKHQRSQSDSDFQHQRFICKHPGSDQLLLLISVERQSVLWRIRRSQFLSFVYSSTLRHSGWVVIAVRRLCNSAS